MFCKKCGAELKENAKFCAKCGAEVPEGQEGENVQETSAESSSEERGDLTQKMPKAPKIPAGLQKNPLVLAGGAVILVILLLVLLLGGKTKIDLNKYLTVQFSGYDTYGEASWDFDTEAFKEDYEGKIKLTGSAKKELKSYGLDSSEIEDYAVEIFLEACVSGKFDKSEKLTNGDEITFTWNCDEEEIGEVFKCKVKHADKSYTVSGLEEIETVDPFEDIDVVFSGIAPRGTVSITNNSTDEMVSTLSYFADPNGDLSNGDVITVRASYNMNLPKEEFIEYCIEQYGKAPSITEKEYTVEGLGSYVSTVSEIPEDTMDKMKSQTEDQIQAYAAQSWKEGQKLDKVTYIGSYFLQRKDTGDVIWIGNTEDNAIYMVYRIDVCEFNEEKEAEQYFSYYYTCTFYDLIMMPDGTCSVDLSDYRTCSNKFERKVPWPVEGWSAGGYGTYYYFGFEDIDSMFNKIVTSNLDDYTYESTVEDVASDAETDVSEETESEEGSEEAEE